MVKNEKIFRNPQIKSIFRLAAPGIPMSSRLRCLWENAKFNEMFPGHACDVRKFPLNTTGDIGKPLAEGDAAIFQNRWHHLELGMAGDRITVSIDENILAVLHESSHLRGQPGFGCDGRGADFAIF